MGSTEEGDLEGVETTTTMSTFRGDIIRSGRMGTILDTVENGITMKAVAETKLEEGSTLTFMSTALITIPLITMVGDGTHELGEVSTQTRAGSNKITAITHKAGGDLEVNVLMVTAIKIEMAILD